MRGRSCARRRRRARADHRLAASAKAKAVPEKDSSDEDGDDGGVDDAGRHAEQKAREVAGYDDDSGIATSAAPAPAPEDEDEATEKRAARGEHKLAVSVSGRRDDENNHLISRSIAVVARPSLRYYIEDAHQLP